MCKTCRITCLLAAGVCIFITLAGVKAGESAAREPAALAWRTWLQAHPLPLADQDQFEEAILVDLSSQHTFKPELVGAQLSGREGRPGDPLMVALRLRTGSNPAPPFAQARWIAPPANADGSGSLPLFRKEFSVDAKPGKATLRIVGLGDYDPRVNGTRLADTGINQPWSQYEKTIYYRDFDITSLVHPGSNCVGVMLGNSFWHNPSRPPVATA